MLTHPIVAAVTGRRRRSEIDATIYVPPYSLIAQFVRRAVALAPVTKCLGYNSC
jgi:hypothetical protein